MVMNEVEVRLENLNHLYVMEIDFEIFYYYVFLYLFLENRTCEFSYERNVFDF